jgi:Uma2 family endonuclease
MSGVTTTSVVHYPERDGKPMGETEFHIAVILYLFAALRQYFRNTENVYAGADMLLYYEEGNPGACVVPDVFVAKGVGKHKRRTFKIWEEKTPPCVVFEITSRSTRLDDLGNKRALYEMLGVGEYFLFDPLNEYLSPRLQGFRLAGGAYQPVPIEPDGTIVSKETGLILKPEGEMLRLIDSGSGSAMPTMDEIAEQADAQTQRANAETQRADAETRRANAETRRANAETRRADAETERANRAEAELARLRAQLEDRNPSEPA